MLGLGYNQGLCPPEHLFPPCVSCLHIGQTSWRRGVNTLGIASLLLWKAAGRGKGKPRRSTWPGCQRVSAPRGPGLHVGSRRNFLCPREGEDLFHVAAHSGSGRGSLAVPPFPPALAAHGAPLAREVSDLRSQESAAGKTGTPEWRRQGCLLQGRQADSNHALLYPS